ncbi:MAG TPA: DUF2147 domain-containing protein [Verrucomicrobiae bacterium]|jgi:uncharacterized protein (DUF2147 family)|nr:DUF2147 domain-containing protein [Verrucomicrobiae bacterium]
MRNIAVWLVLSLALSALAQDADSILGLWHTSENRSVVRLTKRNDHYFGQILTLKEPAWPADDKQGMAGQPKNDRNNPDPSLRARPIAGIEFLTDFTYAGDNLWEKGKIYDPEVGKTYKCRMTLLNSNTLEVRGYIGLPLLGRTVTWTR